MILDFKGWLFEFKTDGKHGGDRSSLNPCVIGADVKAINPARDIVAGYYPTGPMQPKGKLSTAGKMKKPRSGIVGRMKKK